MINPCSVSCRAVISYSLRYDAWGASTYLALKHATALVNKHKLTDFQGISLCNRIIDQRKYHSHVTEDSTAHIWIAPEKFTEQEEQVIKAYYMRQLLGRKILHARSKDFRKRSKESDTTLWLLQEGMSHLSQEDTDMADKENQNLETFTGNPQWGTEIPPEYDLTEPTARK